MSQFWLYAAVLALLAALFMIWPFLRHGNKASKGEEGDRQALILDLFNESRQELEAQRASGEIDENQYQQLMKELESTLLEDSAAAASEVRFDARWPLVIFAGFVVVGAFVFYQQRGSLQDVAIQTLLEQRFQQQMAAMQTGEAVDDEVTHELIHKLQQRIAARPDQQENRYLLARLAAETDRYGLAVQQYTAILQSLPEPNPKLMAELAQVVFLASGSRMTDEVSLLVEKALELDPNETTALGLAGIAAFENKAYETAIRHWNQAIAQLPANSPIAQGLLGGVQRAQAMLATGSEPATSPAEEQTSSQAIAVSVALAEGVKVSDDAFVLVYAREWGGKMPLAISRFRVDQLPTTVTLDKSMSMMPGVDITTVSQLEIVARVSTTGGAVPQSGDWQESKGPLLLSEAARGLSLIVSRQLP